MSDELKVLYSIQLILKETGYFDVSRISKEILDFSKKEGIDLEKILKRIQKNEPWEYIRGSTDFLGYPFIVNRNVLIPRTETEQLVTIAKGFLDENNSCTHIIDVGTGSGCIIISLAKILCGRNKYKFLGIEDNKSTLEVARKNSALHKVNEKVSLTKQNLLSGTKIEEDTLIIANLPYVPKYLYNGLDKSVKDYEPKRAIVGGTDGLKYYKKLLKQVSNKNHLGRKVTLLIEIEPSTIGNLVNLLENKDFKIIKDFRGRERFLLISLP